MLLDRKKDLIISGGFNIYPSDLEADCWASTRAWPRLRWWACRRAMGRNARSAFVVLKTGSVATAAGLLAWANGRLGKIQRLAAVELTGGLPRSAIGKVMKRELREVFRVQAAARADRPPGAC